MVNLLINAVFWLINKVYSIILSPLFAILNTLMPNANIVEHILNFLTLGLQYMGTLAGLLCIPSGAFTLLITYLELKFTVFVVMKVAKLSLNVYNKLKP